MQPKLSSGFKGILLYNKGNALKEIEPFEEENNNTMSNFS